MNKTVSEDFFLVVRIRTNLISVCMPANHDGLCPSWHQARDGLADDGLSEHGPAQDVADGSVGTGPHALQLEL